MIEEKDQLPEEESTEEKPVEETEEITEEEKPEEESEKTKEESKSNVDEALELAKALQKGYTLTRQEIATIRQNQEAILEKLGKKDTEYEDDEPLTAKKLGEILRQQEERKSQDQQKLNSLIDSQIEELKARGTIRTQEEEDELLKYAVKHKIRDLFQAAGQWEELKEARRFGEKAKVKTKVQQEAGSKVGTSQKTKIEKEEGIPYEDIHNKDMSELIEE